MFKNVILFPPFYFYFSFILSFVLFFIFPGSKIIVFPFNLIGGLAIIFGYYIMKNSCNIFLRKQTSFFLKTPSEFIQIGFYKISRNPMYLGMLICLFGQVILMGNLVPFIGPLFFFLCIHYLCIPPEEVIMEKTFGFSYLQYKRKVRRWL